MNIKFTMIKIMDLAYIAVIYCFIALLITVMTEEIKGFLPKQDDAEKSTWVLLVEIITYVWYIAITVYVVRNVVEYIPSPFDKMYGFSHMKIKELHSASMFSIIFIHLQEGFMKKLKYFWKDRLSIFG